jgi:2Fe-2S ferredoxin
MGYMPRILVSKRDGVEEVLEAAVGLSVMEIIRDGGIEELLAVCGGSCSCGTCHVYVEGACSGLLPPMGSAESDILDASNHRSVRSRLACQIAMSEALDGLEVTIAAEE